MAIQTFTLFFRVEALFALDNVVIEAIVGISEISTFPWAYLAPLTLALICFAAVWPFSVWRRDASLVDVLWGPGFLLQILLVAFLVPVSGARAVLLISVIGVWSLRLAWVLIRRRIKEGHEDSRYTSVRKSWGGAFWWKSFFVVFVLQACLQWMIVIAPIHGVLSPDQTLGMIAWIGCFVSVLGLSLETISDHQLDRFKSNEEKAHRLLMTGLRSYVRHPNYLGEIIFWSGVGLIILDTGSMIGLLPPVLIFFLLTKISGAPLLDERLGETRPEYAEYRSRVPAFFPRLGSPNT